MSNVISLDFETYYSKKNKYTLTTQIAESYCRSPLFDPYLLSVSNGTDTWAGSPKDFKWEALDGKTLVSHNKYFDASVYAEMVRRGWAPKINIVAWHCTANLTAYLCNRRALAQAVEYLYKVKLNKQTRGDADGRQWPKDFSELQQKEMLAYARSDAHWCWKLWNDYSAQWPAHEQRLSNLTIDQGMRGVQIDRPLLDNYIVWTHEMKAATEKLLPWLSDEGEDSDYWNDFDAKPTSIKCIAEMCRRNGIPCPPVKAHEGEEAYEDWEATYTQTNPWIPALSSWRSINKLHKSFLAVKERLRDDGTMPFGQKFFGAHTGRTQGDAKINMMNMRKVPMFANESGLMETNQKQIDAWVRGEGIEKIRHAIDFRKLFIPRPGKKMILADLSQVEPRVMAWLSGDSAALELMSKGLSPYEVHARTKMGWTGGDLKKENPGMYALAKAQILALGYGAGWRKFIIMAHDYTGQDFTEGDPEWIDVPDPITGEIKQVSGYGQRARKIVADFREQNKLTVGMWKSLDDAFKRSVASDFVMTLPSGRQMKYENVKCETRITPDPEIPGKLNRKTVFTADIGGRRVESYGGSLSENCTQACARDVFMEGVLRITDAGHNVLWSVYDEVICEVDPSVKPDDISSLMTQTPAWMPGLTLAAEGKEVSCYEK